jgi:hypothetical protein
MHCAVYSVVAKVTTEQQKRGDDIWKMQRLQSAANSAAGKICIA